MSRLQPLEPANDRPWGRLELGHDAGGRRWFLEFEDGRRDPLNAGTGLELKLYDHVVPVSIETEAGHAVLYMSLGEDIDGGGDEDAIRAPRVKLSSVYDDWHGVELRRRPRGRWR